MTNAAAPVVVADCGTGTTCTKTVAKPASPHTYVAEIAKPNGSQLQTTSAPMAD